MENLQHNTSEKLITDCINYIKLVNYIDKEKNTLKREQEVQEYLDMVITNIELVKKWAMLRRINASQSKYLDSYYARKIRLEMEQQKLEESFLGNFNILKKQKLTQKSQQITEEINDINAIKNQLTNLENNLCKTKLGPLITYPLAKEENIVLEKVSKYLNEHITVEQLNTNKRINARRIALLQVGIDALIMKKNSYPIEIVEYASKYCFVPEAEENQYKKIKNRTLEEKIIKR